MAASENANVKMKVDIIVAGNNSLFNPINASVAIIKKTSQLVYIANQLTSFYMTAILTFKGLYQQGLVFNI